MFDTAISQLSTPRWELPREVERVAARGFEALSIWRPKVSDLAPTAVAAVLARAGLRISSLQWAGGFTGADGRSHAESVTDALEAIQVAEGLGAPVLVVHSGCRGGHTRSHARRLLGTALESLLPAATRAGVTLALKPIHAAAACGCSFLTGLAEALDLVEAWVDPALGLALDLWQFADADDLEELTPRLAERTAIVQVADRRGPPSAEIDRLPAGSGSLPLAEAVVALVAAGYRGAVEFDAVGEAVEALGYDAVLDEARRTAADWRERCDAPWFDAPRGLRLGRAAQRAAAGSLRSQASSHIVSPR